MHESPAATKKPSRMKREYPESPLVGVGAVIVDYHREENRVLLIRRGTAPLLGEWSLPGGVLECGETLRDAVVVRYHYVLIDFLCRPVSGDLKAGSDAADVRWFMRDELPALNLANDANDVVLKGLARTMERRASSPG